MQQMQWQWQGSDRNFWPTAPHTEQDCPVCGGTGKDVKEGELPITKFKKKAENLVDKEDEDSI
jgi:hypothetical protein